MRFVDFDALADADPAVDDLQPETITAVAERIARSEGFSELVYRECEINALWSLADIGISGSEHRSLGSWVVGGAPLSRALLFRLRERFEEAYELLVDSATAEASRVLEEAAALSASEK